jgi:TnpA family transposase
MMKQDWSFAELVEHFTLDAEALHWLSHQDPHNQLGAAALLTTFRYLGRFPTQARSVPLAIRHHLASQLSLSPELFDQYDWQGRSAERHRQWVRERLGIRETTVADGEALAAWLSEQALLYQDQRLDVLVELLYERCRTLRLEPPSRARLERIARSGLYQHEGRFSAATLQQLSPETQQALDQLLETDVTLTQDTQLSLMHWLKSDAGQASVAQIQRTAQRLQRLQAIALPATVFANSAQRVVASYARRAATEGISELRRRQPAVRYTLLTAFCWQRRREITDQLVGLLLNILRKLNARAERRVEARLIAEVVKTLDDKTLVIQLLEAALEQPDGQIKDILYPIVSPTQMRQLLEQYRRRNSASYERDIHTVLRASYQYHYRQLLPILLDALTFRSKSQSDLIQAIKLVKRYSRSRRHTYPAHENVPIAGIVPTRWQPLVLEQSEDGEQRVNRINYELSVLTSLREQLRCKAVWVEGAEAYRDPDQDLPADFQARRVHYYQTLALPQDAATFTQGLQQEMMQALQRCNDTLADNDTVSIRPTGHIKIARLKALAKAPTIRYLRTEVQRLWPATGLLDMLQEVEWRTNFSQVFNSAAAYERLGPAQQRERLLLCLFGLGTNVGLHAMALGAGGFSYEQLLYTRRRLIDKDGLRAANVRIINATRHARWPHIWGEGNSVVAADSRQFATYGHNLYTEWHVRYHKKGVKIYWHVDTQALAIYSQVTRPSSSEVADMIEGIMRHHSEMAIERSYVDTHGQSTVGFAFCHLLGFELLPRIKGIHKKRLYRPRSGYNDDYPALQPILTRPIDWDLIEQQYDAMVHYVTAVYLGTARTEAILRRFNDPPTQHPTYKAFVELGRAVQTIFLCRYLSSEALRREINSGLNVVEHWHNANDFVFYGQQSELTSARYDDQVVSALSLHLLQNCLVHVNTLMVQQILKDEDWYQRMTPRDWQALTPLFWAHVNPYGDFRLDLNKRLPRLEHSA